MNLLHYTLIRILILKSLHMLMFSLTKLLIIISCNCLETISLSYKLEFETTNNVAEYEALVLGLRDAKDTGIKKLLVFGDA